MSKKEKIKYCDNCGSKHIEFAKYFCSVGCYNFYHDRLNWTLEQVTLEYLYNHINQVLDNPKHEHDAYLLSRSSDLINKEYKEKYFRYPATGEPLPLHLR